MTNFTEANSFDANVYLIATTDQVLGGSGAIANLQGQALTNRTRWLYNQVVALTGAGYAPINSPTFTGSAAAPTGPTGDNTTLIATDQFVQTAVNGFVNVNVAGSSNVTLTAPQYGVAAIYLSGALTGNINVIFPAQAGQWVVLNATTGAYSITCKTPSGTGIIVAQGRNRQLGGDGTNIYAAFTDYTNAALLGACTAPTASPGDSSATIATTAFVATSFAPLASPGLTGTPTAPTAGGSTNTTQIATTAFVATNYAKLASPALTGTPTAPTATPGTNTTQLATTAFVVASYAPLASPALTGTPTAPTAGGGTNTTQVATTAFVAASFAPLASPALSGTPTAPTAAVSTNTTQVATTAFVQAALPARFASSQQTLATSVQVAHGLGALPFDVEVYLHCISADLLYTVGQEVKMPSTTYTAGGGGIPAGVSVISDATNITVYFNDLNHIYMVAVLGSTGNTSTAVINPLRWTVVLRATL